MRDRVSQQRPEAIGDPAAAAWRGEHNQPPVRELDGLQRLQPGVIRGLADGEREVLLHPRPYVLELGVHGSV
jgi:hypothetical protein